MKKIFVFVLTANLFFTRTNGQPDARVTANFIYSPKTSSLLLINSPFPSTILVHEDPRHPTGLARAKAIVNKETVMHTAEFFLPSF